MGQSGKMRPIILYVLLTLENVWVMHRIQKEAGVMEYVSWNMLDCCSDMLSYFVDVVEVFGRESV